MAVYGTAALPLGDATLLLEGLEPPISRLGNKRPVQLIDRSEHPQNESNALIVVRNHEPGSTGGGKKHPVTELNGRARLRRARSRSAGRGMSRRWESDPLLSRTRRVLDHRAATTSKWTVRGSNSARSVCKTKLHSSDTARRWTRRESNPLLSDANRALSLLSSEPFMRAAGVGPAASPESGERSTVELRAQSLAARWNRTSISRASTGRLDHVGQSGERLVRESDPSHPVDSRRPSPEGQRGIRLTGENRTLSRLSPRGVTTR
jgi:hypothetical protein